MEQKIQKYNFSNYLWFYLKKKKTTFIIPLVIFALLVITGLVLSVYKHIEAIDFLVVVPIFIAIAGSVIYGTIFSINVFKSMEKEGLELIICSRPVTRKNILFTRLVYLLIFGLINSLLIMLAFLTFLFVLRPYIGQENFVRYLVASFGVNLFAFYLFSLITALLAVKFNRRVAIAFSLSIFTPLFLVGNLSTYFSESRMNGLGVRLNNNYNKLDTYAFNFENNNDEIYLVNRTNKDNYENVKTLFNEAKDNANIAQIMGWLNIPYQMGIISSNKGSDFFNNQRLSNSTYLQGLDFYKNNHDVRFNYEIAKNDLKFFVPTAPLINDDIENAQEKWSTNSLIYAWEKADSKNELVEDNFGFSSIDDFAGKLEWKTTRQLLHSNAFKEFYLKHLNLDENDSNWTTKKINQVLFEVIDEFLKDQAINQLFLNNNIVEDYQKQIYFYLTSYYFIYYNFNNSELQKALLLNNNQEVKQSQYLINVKMKGGDVRVYKLGGFSSFLPIIETIKVDKSTKQVSRIKLQQDIDASIFKEVSNIYKVSRASQAFPDYAVALAWSLYLVILASGVIFVYNRKDFK
ncbi:ABC-2 transporter permease [Mycoplasmopsis alligatoris]|uniref:Uncharacterized protein n=1 Tax=Mycoplasmopsis alligatoris A21JP2 TaxID=747682 RepID=D4XW89_9BACT|nr:ABC transporter permease [Mycoplasmopsis alligatoris]EFF41395.1 hypothetical protein MALL_0752 [Mycoplasmopsis alligatoris A21JP2]